MFNRRRSDRNGGGHETSLIARGMLVRGDVRFTGALHVEGRIDGSVTSEDEHSTFTLSEHGDVEGEVRVPVAVINGHITGDVTVTQRLELAAQARLDGDLRYATLEMAAGAQVNGRIQRLAEPVPAELPAPASGNGEVDPA